MISAKELRIGNWITHAQWNLEAAEIEHIPIKITGREIELLERSRFLCYNPIPLTPDVLERCGFENTTGNNFVLKLDTGAFIRVWIDPTITYFFFHPHDKDDGQLRLAITSLHHLQNIFFALTGKELEIKL